MWCYVFSGAVRRCEVWCCKEVWSCTGRCGAVRMCGPVQGGEVP